MKDKILGRGRAKEWQAWEPPDPSLRAVRNKFGGTVSDEELLLRVYAGEAAVKALATTGAPRAYLSAQQPLIHLIEELSKKRGCSQVFICRPDFSLKLSKSTASAHSS